MDLIPILSLVVAALALFVGPMLSAHSTKQAMLGPMRQKWINDLRALLSEISSRCLHYFQTGYEDRTDKDYQRLTDIEHQIIFMLNPNEPENKELIKTIRTMVSALEKGKNGDNDFISSHEQLLNEGKAILKKEWNVIKNQNKLLVKYKALFAKKNIKDQK